MSTIPIFNAVRIIPRESDFLNRKTGSRGEIFYDRDSNSLRLYDGKSAGGINLAKSDLSNVVSAVFREKSVESRIATVVYNVTVAGAQGTDVGNKYFLNDEYRLQPNLVIGYTYVFDQDDATNVYWPNATETTANPHPLNFSADNISGELGGGTSYLENVRYLLDGVAVSQTVYNSAAFNTATARQVQITITGDTPNELFYWCYNHAVMGNSITVAEPGSGTGDAGVSIAESPPDGPLVGQLWFDTITGILHVYYQDIDSAQWVQPSNISFGASGGNGGGLSNSFTTISVQGQGNVIADSPTDTLTLVAGQGIVISTDTLTDAITFTSVATTGNITIVDTTIDTNNGNPITITPNLQLEGTLRFADNTVQTTATVQGPAGPPGPTGSGAGDVSSVEGGYTDNAIVRYSGTSGNSIKTSLASINNAGTLSATAFSGAGTSLTALNASNLGSGTVPVLRLGTAGTRNTTTFLRGDNTWAVISVEGGAASNSFATIAVVGQNSVVAESATDTLTLAAGTGISITTNAGTDTVTFTNVSPNVSQNVFATIAVAGQNNVVADSATDTLTLIAGTNISITTDAGTDAITINATAAQGTTSNSFTTIAVAGQNDVVADSAADTLTLAAGTGITITTNAATDTVTITSTASGGTTTFTGLSDSANATIDQIYLPAITSLTVSNSGASAYLFDQYTGNNPTIYAINGTTIAFKLNVAGHPFLIQNAAGANFSTGLVHVTTDGVVTTGANAQGKTTGTLYWKIPSNITGGHRYQCSLHGGMVGSIVVKDFATI